MGGDKHFPLFSTRTEPVAGLDCFVGSHVGLAWSPRFTLVLGVFLLFGVGGGNAYIVLDAGRGRYNRLPVWEMN